MKQLLTAIKAQLQTDLSYVRDSDVFITEDENLIPSAVKFPAVGLKDGPVIRVEMIGGMMEYHMTVKIVALVQLTKSEAAIMGDTSTGKKGILDMESDIHESLDENLLSITGMIAAIAAANQPESEVFGDEVEVIQRKVIAYEYVKETERPSQSA
jgi:hypothetical protein